MDTDYEDWWKKVYALPILHVSFLNKDLETDNYYFDDDYDDDDDD